jgi:actin-related protein
MEKDIRQYAHSDFDINIIQTEDPISWCWRGASIFASSYPQQEVMTVSKAEYHEHGNERCKKKFLL